MATFGSVLYFAVSIILEKLASAISLEWIMITVINKQRFINNKSDMEPTDTLGRTVHGSNF